jgi:hypothetical protein
MGGVGKGVRGATIRAQLVCFTKRFSSKPAGACPCVGLDGAGERGKRRRRGRKKQGSISVPYVLSANPPVRTCPMGGVGWGGGVRSLQSGLDQCAVCVVN